ncbi:hypothetical protein B0H16DRAFT_1549775 [Mycena metata]|uniref:F-box domain-containing protein n=1 Tax=Mycena metata TaxID=1033252 RepID=A0AAD7ITL2_9AGAR|nr:hypothetical protein B0H16DRAFT_1549775 [Mycena metata]
MDVYMSGMQPDDQSIGPLSDSEGSVLKQTAPIYTLAWELLAEIMLLTLTPRIDSNIGNRRWMRRYPSPATAKDVLVLCRVCSHWRTVALNTPRLWATITLPIMNPKNIQEVASLLTNMFLERSAPFPVSIQFYPIFSANETITVPPMVTSACNRWKTFVVGCDMDEFDVASLARIPLNGLNNLERLQLQWSMPVTWNGSELDVFSSAPRLRDVTIRVPLATSNTLSIPWAQLRHLSLTYMSPQVCLDALASCQNLVSGRFITEQWPELHFPGDSDVARPALLAYLTELEIHTYIWTTGEHLGPFLRRFSLPALKKLTLSLSLEVSPDDEHFISRLTPTLTSLLHSSPNLQYLQLRGCIDAEDMPDVLQRTRNLTELVFRDSQVNDDFFAALTYSRSTPLVPKLETMTLIDIGIAFDETSFGGMISSRWWSYEEPFAMVAPPGVARLRRLKFRNDIPYPEDTKDFSLDFRRTMQQYSSQGFEFVQTNHEFDSP